MAPATFVRPSEKVKWKKGWSLKRKTGNKNLTVPTIEISYLFLPPIPENTLSQEKCIGSVLSSFGYDFALVVHQSGPPGYSFDATGFLCLFPRWKKKNWRRSLDNGLYYYQPFSSPLETPCYQYFANFNFRAPNKQNIINNNIKSLELSP